MSEALVKIVTYVPVENADTIREILGRTGAGQLGEYSFCSFSSLGSGRYIPSDKARPHMGSANNLEVVSEERIEVVCPRVSAKEVIATLKLAHPYEEVAVDIYPLLNEDEL